MNVIVFKLTGEKDENRSLHQFIFNYSNIDTGEIEGALKIFREEMESVCREEALE